MSGATSASETQSTQAQVPSVVAWLKFKSVRLHKHTNEVAFLDWPILLNLNDENLAVRGISTNGARGKFLREFAAITDSIVSLHSNIRGRRASKRMEQAVSAIEKCQSLVPGFLACAKYIKTRNRARNAEIRSEFQKRTRAEKVRIEAPEN